MSFKISLNELKILSALVGKEKYGLQILKKVNGNRKKGILLGSLYNSLASLEKKGLVESWLSDEDSGGGQRRYFKVTGAGQREAYEQRQQLDAAGLWDINNPAPEGSHG